MTTHWWNRDRDETPEPAPKPRPPDVGWKPRPGVRRMTAEERERLGKLSAQVKTLAAEERRAAVKGKRPIMPCAECLHLVEAACGARPLEKKLPSPLAFAGVRVKGRWYVRATGTGCADLSEMREAKRDG